MPNWDCPSGGANTFNRGHYCSGDYDGDNHWVENESDLAKKTYSQQHEDNYYTPRTSYKPYKQLKPWDKYIDPETTKVDHKKLLADARKGKEKSNKNLLNENLVDNLIRAANDNNEFDNRQEIKMLRELILKRMK